MSVPPYCLPDPINEEKDPLFTRGLWLFSSQLYEITPACASLIHLQERCQTNVCAVLCALWLAKKRGVGLSAPQASMLKATARQWERRWITPVRRARRTLKNQMTLNTAEYRMVNHLYKELLRTEIRLEHRLLAILCALSKDWPGVSGQHNDEAVTDLVSRNIDRVLPPKARSGSARETLVVETCRIDHPIDDPI